MTYQDVIASKHRRQHNLGFDVDLSSTALFDFQQHLTQWALKLGRSAIFADCGLGKTPMQLIWADSIARNADGNVLILTPLAVADQTMREASKFGIECTRGTNGNKGRITVTNYERLHYYSNSDFCGVVCDESSILKNYAGATRQAITDFMQPIDYRLLCTATPAPNDYMELGTSCEALSIMRRVEMLAQYFTHNSGDTQSWVLKGHAYSPFWRFVASWARALRSPSDLGFDEGKFTLPELMFEQTTINSKAQPGRLFVVEARTLQDQREERRSTMQERCEVVADIANRNSDPFIAWCSLNDESKLLTSLIDGAVEVCGADSDDAKAEKMLGFTDGSIRAIVTKPSIAGFGMNWQHCRQMSFFPSHSHEQFYQCVRRCWRFGQTNPVTVHIVTSEAEASVLANMQRKEKDAERMMQEIVDNMKSEYSHEHASYEPSEKMEIPKWLKSYA